MAWLVSPAATAASRAVPATVRRNFALGGGERRGTAQSSRPGLLISPNPHTFFAGSVQPETPERWFTRAPLRNGSRYAVKPGTRSSPLAAAVRQANRRQPRVNED